MRKTLNGKSSRCDVSKERNCHRLKAVFRKCVGNASGSRQGESTVVLYVAGVNGRLRESILKDTLSKSGTADITSSLF